MFDTAWRRITLRVVVFAIWGVVALVIGNKRVTLAVLLVLGVLVFALDSMSRRRKRVAAEKARRDIEAGPG